MSNTLKMMEKIIKKCDLYLGEEIFSKEELIRTLGNFMISTIDKEKHNVGVVLHTGSICYDALSIVFAALSNVVMDETDINDFVSSLNIGDTVLYGDKIKQRYTFEGFLDSYGKPSNESIRISQGSGYHISIIRKTWNQLSHYNVSNKRLDGRGLKRNNGVRVSFYKDILGYNQENIPSAINTSTVIVMPRDRADSLINNLSISFNNLTIKLLELVTSSYFTSNEEHPYSGNPGKTDPVLKITSKIDVARKLILSRDRNTPTGLFVLGNDIVAKSQSEIPELINRKSLKYVFVNLPIDSVWGPYILKQCDSPSLFPCTKRFLEENSSSLVVKNFHTNELSKQIETIKHQNITSHILPGNFSWSEYKNLTTALYEIKSADFDSTQKGDFIMQSYSLLKVMVTAVFQISEVEKMITKGKIGITSPKVRLLDLSKLAVTFPSQYFESSQLIISTLKKGYDQLTEYCEKEVYLREFLTKHSDKRIGIIVPKAYYVNVMKETGFYDYMNSDDFLRISTANSFDNSILYDEIIAVGFFSGNRFDPFRCRSAPNIKTLLYNFELSKFNNKMREAQIAEEYLNSQSTININKGLPYGHNNSTTTDDSEVVEIQNMEDILNDYVSELNEISIFNNIHLQKNSGITSPSVDVVAIGSFESGETVLFTKRYKAYVFDNDTGKVQEVTVSDLSESDSIVFTQNNSESRDIVDGILDRLVQENTLTEDVIESYRKSKYWKKTLINFMNKNNVPASDIAFKMIANGVQVQEATILGWLDEDSHTVGPRKKDSIEQIALLVNDEEMFQHADDYFEACRVIRSKRLEILKKIGEAIIQKLSGRIPKKGTILFDIYYKIDSLAIVLHLESIKSCNQSAPINLTNRPITL